MPSLPLPTPAPVVVNLPSPTPDPQVRIGITHSVSVETADQYRATIGHAQTLLQSAIYYGRGSQILVATMGYDLNRYTGLPPEIVSGGNPMILASPLAPGLVADLGEDFGFLPFSSVWVDGYTVENPVGGRTAVYGIVDLLGVINVNIPGLLLRVVERSHGKGDERKYAIVLTIQADFPDSEVFTVEAALRRAEWMSERRLADAPVWIQEAINDAIGILMGVQLQAQADAAPAKPRTPRKRSAA